MPLTKFLSVKVISSLFIVFALLYFGFAVVTPWILTDYVNKTIAKSEAYEGSVGSIKILLWEAGYQITDIKISKKMADIPVPLFEAPKVTFRLYRKEMFNGRVLGDMVLSKPVIYFIDGEGQGDSQTGKEGPWLRIVDALFPLKIDHLRVQSGQVHFRNYVSQPKVFVYITNVNAEVQHLASKAESVTLNGDGQLMADGQVEFSVVADAYSQRPDFQAQLTVRDFNIMHVDALLRRYAPFDLEAGTLQLAFELGAKNGQLNGYAKPVISGLDIFEWHEDVKKDGDNPIQVIWEGAAGILSELFENQSSGNFAMKVPIKGDLTDPQLGYWLAIGSILRNAFVEKITPTFE